MKFRSLLASAAIVAFASIGVASHASAASLVICDAEVCGAPEGSIVFSVNDFEGNFQINSAIVQQGLGNPTSTTVPESAPGGGPNEIDFSGTWILGGPIVPQNETIFFIEPKTMGDISDVLHFTYTQDANGLGHLDGTVISDAEGSLNAFVASHNIFATQTVSESANNGVFRFDNTNITASFQSDVPEPAVWAMMLLGFGGLGATMRMRRRDHAPTAA